MNRLYKGARALAGRLLRRTLSALLSALRRTPWGSAQLDQLRERLPGPWQKLRVRFGPAAPTIMIAAPDTLLRHGNWKTQEQRLQARIWAHFK